MATLEKIRNRSGLLIGILALALGLFILQSALESGNSFFTGSRRVVGEVKGEKIKIDEFQAKVDQALQNERMRTGKSNIDENTTDMIRQQVWNQMVFEKIMYPEYDKLGIAVSTDELYDMVQGSDPHPSVKQAFTDPNTGQFNPQSVVTFLKRMDEDQTGETRARWMSFETAIKQERVNTKYLNLLKKGFYVTKNQAKSEYDANNASASFTYLLKRYDSLGDSTMNVTEKDAEKYYNNNKSKYKQEAGRTIEFVAFDIKPSEEDMNAVNDEMQKLKEEFAAATDDSLFVSANSDGPFNASFVKKGTFPAEVDSQLFNAAEKTVVGPYRDKESLKLAKVSKVKMAPDSVKARHILIKFQGDNKQAMAKADSLKKVIKAGKKFDEIAKTVSEDVGSAAKGGDLGWFQEGQMVKPFNDAVFNGKKGDMPIVESQFGIHLIEILDKGKESKRVQIAVVERLIEPSNKTFQAAYGKASEFAAKYSTPDAFNKAIIDQGLNKKIADVKENDRNVQGLTNSRELVRWSFENEKGSLSGVKEFGNTYVIAHLKEVKEKGIAPFEQVKEDAMKKAITEKKAEKFIEQFNDAKKSASSLADLGTKAAAAPMNVDNQMFAQPYIQGVGREPFVVGTVFGLAKGKMSEPVKGETGVYVIQQNELKAAPAGDLTVSKDQLLKTSQSRVDYEMFDALKEKADVVDNRARFF